MLLCLSKCLQKVLVTAVYFTFLRNHKCVHSDRSIHKGLRVCTRMASANLIISNLWLGKYSDAKCQDFVREHSITVVLCVCDTPPIESEQFQCIVIPANDCAHPSRQQTSQFCDIILTCIDIIEQKLADKQSVLVVCGAGRQRSAAVVAAYLARHCMSDKYRANVLEDAVTHVMMKRPVAFRTIDRGYVTEKVHWLEAMRLATQGSAPRLGALGTK